MNKTVEKHVTIKGGRPIEIVDLVMDTVIDDFTDRLGERDEAELDKDDLRFLCFKAIGVYMNISEAATKEMKANGMGDRFIEKFREDLTEIGLNLPDVSFAGIDLSKPCPDDAPPEMKKAYAEAKLRQDTA